MPDKLPYPLINGPLRRILRWIKMEAQAPGLPQKISPVIVIAEERSGSTLFLDLVAQHSKVIADPHDFLNPERIRRYRFGPRVRFSRCSHRIHKFKFPEIHNETGLNTCRSFIREMQDDGIQIIRLVRRELISQCLSVEKAAITQQLHNRTKNSSIQGTYEVDPKRLANSILHYGRLKAFEDQCLEGLDIITINYHEDLRNQALQSKTMERVFTQLGLASESVEATYQKLSEKPATHWVSNPDVLTDVILSIDAKKESFISSISNSEWELYLQNKLS